MMYAGVHKFIAVLATLAGFLLAIAAPVQAEGVEADLTTHSVAVTADFSGANVILFGSVVLDDRTKGESQPDIVVVVKGPKGARNVQRKVRAAGIWTNSAQLQFPDVLGYYAVVSSKPAEEVVPDAVMRRLGIGLESMVKDLVLSKLGNQTEGLQDYAEAIVRIMTNEGLYSTHPNGIRFVGKHLFRAEFKLPSNVPIGDYTALVYMFRDGQLVGRYSTNLQIAKSGIERIIYQMAHEQPFLYGILSVIVAICAGMAAAAAFKKS
jgi:uncharacterized protein (TIGR02186 family)